jgi:pantoate--beta-alanine ligase
MMPRRLPIARTLPSLRRARAGFGTKTVALVPTMGALHRGHLALVKDARRRADRVIVSIFVNPTQFAPHEDFGSYPRTFERDIAALTEAKADLVWAPTAALMYPDGFVTRIEPGGAAKAGLEDKFRPHFFGAVATVVAKLFTQTQPDVALFGQKDYQQLRVITQLARDLDFPLKIVGVPTVRERDGLALSSRNAYLSAEQRAVAPTLYQVLKDCAAMMNAGETVDAVLADGRAVITRAGFALDYLEARHALTLAPMAIMEDGPMRLLGAAKLGTTRLIDSVAV